MLRLRKKNRVFQTIQQIWPHQATCHPGRPAVVPAIQTRPVDRVGHLVILVLRVARAVQVVLRAGQVVLLRVQPVLQVPSVCVESARTIATVITE